MPENNDGKDDELFRAHDPRYCRTHSLVAELFAKSSQRLPNAAAWHFNAAAWTHLAELKERELARAPAAVHLT